MAYENILFHKSNMAIKDGYFYLLDITNNALSQKLANGNIAFQYPIDIPVTFTYYSLGEVSCLQYDGYSFWSLQDFADNSGVMLRQWEIKNFVCKLVNQIPKVNSANVIYDVETFAVEYYTTNLTNDVNDGSFTINIDEYYDYILYEDTLIGIGYNKFGEREVLTVSGVNGLDVHLKSPVVRSYLSGDNISIVSSLFLFNNYAGTSSSKGSLISLNPYTGTTLSTVEDVEYKYITASKFTRLQGVLQSFPDVHTLTYVKSTNLKLRDMSDLYRYNADVKASDDFSGADYSLPNSDLWDLTYGDPVIFNNKLFYATVGVGHDCITSTYNLVGNFEVQVSGTLMNYTTFSGSIPTELNHYLEISSNLDSNYKIGMTYIDNINYLLFEDDFTTSGISWTHGTGTTLYSSGFMQHITDGAWERSSVVDFGDSWEMSFKFMHTSGGSGNDQYHLRYLYGDGDNYLWLYMHTYSPSSNYVSLRTRLAGVNDTLYTNYSYNYYTDRGSWFQVLLRRDQNVLYFKIWKDGTSEPVSWSYSGSVLGMPTEGSIFSYAALTGGAGTGLDDIYLRRLNYSYDSIQGKHSICVYKNDLIKNFYDLSTPYWQGYRGYRFKVKKYEDTLNFSFTTLTSGIVDGPWISLSDMTVTSDEVQLSLGLTSKLVTVSGSYFDDLIYTAGTVRFPTTINTYYGIMGMDNVLSNGSTIVPIYDIDIEGDDLYRLQNKASYYDLDYSWSSYNFQVSPIRSFIDFITVDADTHILPATGRNTTPIRSVTLDQYGQGVINRPVTFIDDDSVGFITTETVFTDLFYNTGKADTAYTSGISFRVVNINASVTQMD